MYFLTLGEWSFVKESPFWFNAVIIKDAIYTIAGDLIDTLPDFHDFTNDNNFNISTLDPNVKHCILVKKSQSNPTTSPTTTTNPTSTTNPTTTTTYIFGSTTVEPNITTTAATTATIQYEYELVDCNGPIEAYRLCYKEPLNCSEASPGTNRRKRAAVVDAIKDNSKHKANHGEFA